MGGGGGGEGLLGSLFSLEAMGDEAGEVGVVLAEEEGGGPFGPCGRVVVAVLPRISSSLRCRVKRSRGTGWWRAGEDDEAAFGFEEGEGLLGGFGAADGEDDGVVALGGGLLEGGEAVGDLGEVEGLAALGEAAEAGSRVRVGEEGIWGRL